MNTHAEVITVIDADNRHFKLDLLEVFRYRDLIWLFVKRDFKLTYKQTVLGPLWIFLSPLFSTVVYTFIFGNLAGLSTDGTPQFLFYMAGNILWNYFAVTFNGTSNTFVANAGLFGKVYFPRLTVPISHLITALFNLFIQIGMFFIFYLFFWMTGVRTTPSHWIWLVPLMLVQVGLLGMGCGILVSALTTKYRDLSLAVGFGIQLWMFVTPVVYPFSLTGGIMRTILYINPMTMPMELFRYALLGTGQFSFGFWGLSIGITAVSVLVGAVLFNRIEKTFMDTV